MSAPHDQSYQALAGGSPAIVPTATAPPPTLPAIPASSSISTPILAPQPTRPTETQHLNSNAPVGYGGYDRSDTPQDSTSIQVRPAELHDWEFPGWGGSATYLTHTPSRASPMLGRSSPMIGPSPRIGSTKESVLLQPPNLSTSPLPPSPTQDSILSLSAQQEGVGLLDADEDAHGDGDGGGDGDDGSSTSSEPTISSSFADYSDVDAGDESKEHPSRTRPLRLLSHASGTSLNDMNETLLPSSDLHSHKLGQFRATAICGNDILSSCLYASGLCVADAGIYAPIAFVLVALTLYLFRKIYGEAVTALPLNGGAYNVLLNTTSKSTAAIAACLTILSYVATGVVSASEAIDYASHVWVGMPKLTFTIGLICIFALLNLIGISESANVALVIFLIHFATLCVLVVTVIISLIRYGAPNFDFNLHDPQQPTIIKSLIFGFSSAMLGVSGFETSANFVEEQKPGVFVKTLRNMWACVAFFNPLLSLLSILQLRVPDIKNLHQTDLLAEMGRQSGGRWLEQWVSIDAFLVLSGSVLTAYVGVNGLCRRLALDRCLPQFLLAENRWRRTNHWIILGFCGICCSMYLILNGAVDSLANVYSIAFLSVMSLFAIGNMLLKYKRGFLPREVRSSWPGVVAALILAIFAVSGTLAKDTSILLYFSIYFVTAGAIISTMFFRVQTLKIIYHASRAFLKYFGLENTRCIDYIGTTIRDINGQSIAFFAKNGVLSTLNKAVLYVRENEDCAHIRIIHIYEEESQIPPKLLRNVAILDEQYMKIKIDCVLVKGTFCPETIQFLSETLKIPKNLMFITCPKENFELKLDTLGGVRLITH